MALTKEELIGSLQNEIRILMHLVSKVDQGKLDYRPTAKQRSTMELLRYLTLMGRGLVPAIKSGAFDGAAWGAAAAEADKKSFEQISADLASLSDFYAKELAPMTDADFAGQVALFSPQMQSRGAWLVNLVVSGHAAYRTQLFMYLKSCGRKELNTMNLWQGVDAPMQA